MDDSEDEEDPFVKADRKEDMEEDDDDGGGGGRRLKLLRRFYAYFCCRVRVDTLHVHALFTHHSSLIPHNNTTLLSAAQNDVEVRLFVVVV